MVPSVTSTVFHFLALQTPETNPSSSQPIAYQWHGMKSTWRYFAGGSCYARNLEEYTSNTRYFSMVLSYERNENAALKHCGSSLGKAHAYNVLHMFILKVFANSDM